MARHVFDRVLSSQIEELPFISGIKLQQRASVLEALRPLCPTPGRVATLHGEHRRSGAGFRTALNTQDLFVRQFENLRDLFLKSFRRDSIVNSDRHDVLSSGVASTQPRLTAAGDSQPIHFSDCNDRTLGWPRDLEANLGMPWFTA
jgi:hypothetical protein